MVISQRISTRKQRGEKVKMAEIENDFDEIARKRIANLLSKNEGEIRVYLRLLDMVRRIDDKLDIAQTLLMGQVEDMKVSIKKLKGKIRYLQSDLETKKIDAFEQARSSSSYTAKIAADREFIDHIDEMSVEEDMKRDINSDANNIKSLFSIVGMMP